MSNNKNDDHLMSINQFQLTQKQFSNSQSLQSQHQRENNNSFFSNIYPVFQPNVPQQANMAYNNNNSQQLQQQQNPQSGPQINFPPNSQEKNSSSLNRVQQQPYQVNDIQLSLPDYPDMQESSESQEDVELISNNDNSNENNNKDGHDNNIYPELPPEIKTIVSQRANRNEKSRFPHKLFSLLQWSGHDQSRAEISGCGWISDDEFFLDKNLICHHMQIKLNTLNVNLKTLGFVQTRPRKDNLSYFKNSKSIFKSQSNEEHLEKIRKEEKESIVAIQRGFEMPLLSDIELYGMTKSEIDEFKREVIITWESIVGEMIFAIGLVDFMNKLSSHLQKQVYCNMTVIKLVLCPRTPNVMEIYDFAVFLARFGPFQNSQLKIYQYGTILNELRPDLATRGSISPISFFGPNFDNCFSFRHPNCGEYHCYNLPLKKHNTEFLIDEDGVKFKSWQKVIQLNPFLSHMRMEF